MKKTHRMLTVLLCLVSLSGCSTKETTTEKPVIEQGNVQNEKKEAEPFTPQPTKDTSFDISLCFAGDINFDENWETMKFYNKQENGISDCISKELIMELKESDIACLNNEFTYSDRGEALAGKKYTFRADPSRVTILTTLGIDVVKLANNHVYDYGEDALLDTLDTLTIEGIDYMGAGETIEEAMKPVYKEIQGKTIAFVAASRAEKYKMTPQATKNSPGILRCYDTTLTKQVIKEAKRNADFVIAYIHWGTEYSNQLESVQRSSAKEYIDAGADAIIGAHPHCLQGMEYYKGKPIVYSLGNFWFNDKTLDTMLVTLHIKGKDNTHSLEVEVIPAIQKDCKTTIVAKKEEKQRIFQYLSEISVNAGIDENGRLYEVEK